MKVALRIPEEVAISLVDDSYEGDAYERVDEVAGDFMDGAIVGNGLIFLYPGEALPLLLCRFRHRQRGSHGFSRQDGELRGSPSGGERNPGAD